MSQESPSTRQLGRPRTASLDSRILESAASLLNEIGYDNLTMELVAQRADTSKTAIYRRWKTKLELTSAVLDAIKPEHPDWDFGSLREDSIAFYDPERTPRSTLWLTILVGLAPACMRNVDLREIYMKKYVEPSRDLLRVPFVRAVERGELPATANVNLLVEILPILVRGHQWMLANPYDRDYVALIIDSVILPAAKAFSPPQSGGQPVPLNQTAGRSESPASRRRPAKVVSAKRR